MFQQRHYVAIAKVIAEIEEGDLRATMALRLADIFGRDNPKFKYGVFMKACNVPTSFELTF